MTPPPSAPDTAADPSAEADAMLDSAEKEGKLAPLQALMEQQGWMDAKDLMKLAQKDDRTKGKSPEDLASMLESDPSLYDDLAEYRDGGAMETMGGMKPKGPPADEPAEGEEPGEAEPEDFASRMKKMRKGAEMEEM